LNPDYDPTRKHEDEYLVTPCIPGPDHVIKIFQIKQKFSDLRCYVTVTEDPQGIAKEQVGEAIAYAAGQARLTCEKCGRVGNRDGTAPEPTKGGWQVIMCDACKEKWMMERAEKAASK
jgi:hypothetical protein